MICKKIGQYCHYRSLYNEIYSNNRSVEKKILRLHSKWKNKGKKLLIKLELKDSKITIIMANLYWPFPLWQAYCVYLPHLIFSDIRHATVHGVNVRYYLMTKQQEIRFCHTKAHFFFAVWLLTASKLLRKLWAPSLGTCGMSKPYMPWPFYGTSPQHPLSQQPQWNRRVAPPCSLKTFSDLFGTLPCLSRKPHYVYNKSFQTLVVHR